MLFYFSWNNDTNCCRCVAIRSTKWKAPVSAAAAGTVNEDEAARVEGEDVNKSENETSVVGSLLIIWSGKKNRQQRRLTMLPLLISYLW